MADSTNEFPTGVVVPLHDLTAEPGIQRGRGRPRKVEKRPDLYDAWYHQQVSEERRQHIDADQVVRSVRNRADAVGVLQDIRQAVAEEAAALEFQRLELEKRGRDAAQVSSRRIDALVQLGKIELELRKLGASHLDVRSEPVQKIFALWVDNLRDVVVQVLTPEQADVFFTRLTEKMETWEDRAEAIIR